ncbi:MAG: AAA family ATPase [Bryobacterales bacterium]|nr:AAA family ATPase [Bryobacterales bacterium]
MIILLRGLPGSGKSTLARALAPHLHAIVLDKDLVRAALFPGDATEYSTAQDDFVIRLMLEAVRWHLEKSSNRVIFLDGRTHSRLSQVDLVRQFALSLPTHFEIIECACPPETALARIKADLFSGAHPARNRDARLLRDELAKWEPVPYPACRVDTAKPLEESVEEALAYFRHRAIMAP